MNPNLISTKFILTAVIILLSFYLVVVDKTESKTWFDFLKWLMGGYIIGNVGDKLTPLLKDKPLV